MDEAVYNFKQIYGPSFGVFVSDPVFYRFLHTEFFRNFGLEGEFSYLFLLGQADPAPSAFELYVGTYYSLNRFRFNLGYRLYRIRKESVIERFNDIEIGAGFMF
jgi:hypothetical protein